jgi:hypothetical protein
MRKTLKRNSSFARIASTRSFWICSIKGIVLILPLTTNIRAKRDYSTGNPRRSENEPAAKYRMQCIGEMEVI